MNFDHNNKTMNEWFREKNAISCNVRQVGTSKNYRTCIRKIDRNLLQIVFPENIEKFSTGTFPDQVKCGIKKLVRI